jgi:hypothetical protein
MVIRLVDVDQDSGTQQKLPQVVAPAARHVSASWRWHWRWLSARTALSYGSAEKLGDRMRRTPLRLQALEEALPPGLTWPNEHCNEWMLGPWWCAVRKQERRNIQEFLCDLSKLEGGPNVVDVRETVVDHPIGVVEAAEVVQAHEVVTAVRRRHGPRSRSSRIASAHHDQCVLELQPRSHMSQPRMKRKHLLNVAAVVVHVERVVTNQHLLSTPNL